MKIALVTGSNKGIGFEICRQLAKNNVQVILTSPDPELGLEACETLSKEGLQLDYHQLDVTDEQSIQEMVDYVESKYGQLDILVNNAGILLDRGSVFTTDINTIRQTMETNVYGPLLLTQKLIPLMEKHNYGRIVNISSGMGQLSDMNGGVTAYRISKVSINALTRMIAYELQGTNILVNTMCPGWVRTDMGGADATRSPEEGADTAVWLALLPDDGPSGKFFRDRQEFPW
jgi:NAD(P)-dependent dehydrogenase (short-subunit alcohol dehydrogenase family)